MEKKSVQVKKLTVPDIVEKKRQGEKIAALTAYDFLFASLLDQAGLDILLVGDSGSMVFAGHFTTLPYTMDEAIYHCKAVGRGVNRALIVADMPFLSFQVNTEETLKNAGRFFKETSVDAVKLEGGEEMAETVHRLVRSGMPVMGHLGLTPQSIKQFGRYSVQAKTEQGAQKLLKDAKALQEAGAFSVVLEKIPCSLAKKVSEELTIPTIGIGAGPECDGQILVTYDMLGLFEQFKPKFVRRYLELAHEVREACQQYSRDVKTGQFPSAKESF